MHEALHQAQRPHLGPSQGSWKGTPEELLEAARKGLGDLKEMRGDLRIPSTGEVLARDVSPSQAFDILKNWHEQKMIEVSGCGN